MVDRKNGCTGIGLESFNVYHNIKQTFKFGLLTILQVDTDKAGQCKNWHIKDVLRRVTDEFTADTEKRITLEDRNSWSMIWFRLYDSELCTYYIYDSGRLYDSEKSALDGRTQHDFLKYAALWTSEGS